MTSLTEQQRQAVYSVDKNVLVSAGAGSGKTHVLVERYVEILRNDPDLTVDGIIAVTFTRKAAGEMRTRLKGRFRQLTESESESNRWRQCLADIDSARIGTIHSLCESILKAFPAESGIDPQFEVIDEVSQAQLLEDSIDQTFREVIGEELSEIKLLSDHNIEEIRNWIKQMLAASVQFDEAARKLLDIDDQHVLSVMNKVRHRIQIRMLKDAIARSEWKIAYTYLAETFARDKLEQLRFHVVQSIEQIMRGCTDPDTTVEDSERLWQHLEVVAAADLRLGGHSDEAKAIKERLGILRAIARKMLGKPALPASIEERDLTNFQDEKHVANLFHRALRIYNERKKLDLKLDYNDLIGLAYTALSRQDSLARKHYQERIGAILVDEFQDTNTVQAELISFLAGQKTRLFLIGDDKQSIYKFQGADVSTFNEWKRRLTDQEEANKLVGQSMVTKLTVSFRSHPNVVAFVNAVFSRLLAADPSIPYRAGFESLSTWRKGSATEVVEESSNENVVAQKEAFFASGANASFANSGAFPTTTLGNATVSSASNEGETFQQLNLFDFGPKDDDTSGGAQELNVSIYESEQANINVVVFDAEDEDGERNSEVSALTESRAVAKWIDDMISSGAPLLDHEGKYQRSLNYGDFAVLVPKNSNFQIIERGLLERGIPYVTFAGRGFLNRQEVIDLENLLYFLGNPQDSHALLGTLRSPLFAISDDILHELYLNAKQLEAEITLWEALRSAPRRAGYESINRAVNVLKRFIEDAGRLSLSALMRSIIQKTSYDLALMSTDNGRQRSRNLWKLVSIAKEHEELHFFEFAKRLTLMRDFELKQTDAPFESCDSVKLMTIHASKGLEFPAVAMPCLSGRLIAQERRLIFHRNYGFALDTSRGDAEARPNWYRYARQLDQDMEIAERKRLLYVAMTRARDYLGIFFEKDTGQQQESFRMWLADILSVDFHGAIEEPQRKVIQAGSEKAEYSLSYVDRALLQKEARAKTSLSHEAENENSSLSTLLIEPIYPEPVQPHSPWKGWSRVTPGGESETNTLDATTIGTFLHSVLENLPPSLERPDRQSLTGLALYLGRVVAHPSRLNSLVEEGEKLLDTFYSSDLYSLMLKARKRWTELPYTMFDDLGTERRRPDLVLETEDGEWMIVDYKTDAIPAEQIHAQALRHAAQLDTYATDLGKLTGLKFQKRLYFARHGQLVDV